MKDSEVLKDAYLRYEALRRVTPIFWGPNGDGFLTQKVAIPKASPGGSSPASWIVIFLRWMLFFEHMLRTGHCMLLKKRRRGKARENSLRNKLLHYISQLFVKRGPGSPNQLLAKKSGSSQ